MEVENVTRTISEQSLPVTRLSSQEIFQFLRPKQIEALSNASSSFSCKAGDFIYRGGMKAAHFYTVLKGKVALYLSGSGSTNALIDELGAGNMFGSCISFQLKNYSLTAKCIEDCELLKIDAQVLKRMMDKDPVMGYAIQSRISQIYFKRYIETMDTLQNIIVSLPHAKS